MITVDPTAAVAPFEQIRGQLADQIRSGLLPGGARLPAIRQLAGDLRVAPGTVARAYGELEAAGLVESSRTQGTRVRHEQELDEEVRRAAVRFVRAARESSTDLGDALGLVRAEWVRG